LGRLDILELKVVKRFEGSSKTVAAKKTPKRKRSEETAPKIAKKTTPKMTPISITVETQEFAVPAPVLTPPSKRSKSDKISTPKTPTSSIEEINVEPSAFLTPSPSCRSDRTVFTPKTPPPRVSPLSTRIPSETATASTSRYNYSPNPSEFFHSDVGERDQALEDEPIPLICMDSPSSPVRRFQSEQSPEPKKLTATVYSRRRMVPRSEDKEN